MKLAVRRSLLETSTFEPDLLTLSNNSSGANSTGGFFVDTENEEGGFTELQTVALALLATLIPLLFILTIVFTARVVWRKFRSSSEDGGGSLRRAESSEPNGAKSAASMGHLLPEEMKGSESQSTVTPSVDELNETPKSPLLSSSHRPATSGPPSMAAQPLSHNQACAKSANGSIITLTMQNNHLIVETETTGEVEQATSSDAVSADSVTLEGGGVSEQAAQIHDAPPSPPCFPGLSVSNNSLNGPPSYCYSTQSAYGATPLCQPIQKPLLQATSRGDDPGHISAKILRRRLHSAYSTALDDSEFAPNHHRTASLPPIKLTRTNTLASDTMPPPTDSAPTTTVAPRGAGKFKARASLPCINVPLFGRIGGDKPAPIAE